MSIVGTAAGRGAAAFRYSALAGRVYAGILMFLLVDAVLDIHQQDAENTMRMLAVKVFCGVSSGGAVAGALRIARENPGR